MLFHLLAELRDTFGPLNVFRYISFRVIVALFTSLAVTMVLYPGFIRRLQARQIGQVIREEIDEHQSKKNTPTMGGLLLLLAAVTSTLLWSDLTNPLVWLTVGVTCGFGLIGFVDDAMKLGVRGSKGLSERGKLVGQFAVGTIAMSWLFWGYDGFDAHLYFPFVSPDRFAPAIPVWAYVAFGAFFLVCTSNAVNITDGLDGLAIGAVNVATGTYLALAYLSATTISYATTVGGVEVFTQFDIGRYLLLPSVPGSKELAIFCASLIGAGTGFLWYNCYPARVFMGDVGALALGGALGMVAILTKNEFLSVIILGLFVVEAGSSLAQRLSYKFFKKRIFSIAPIHHHFQRKKWSETQIVIRFWIIAILFSLAALASLKLR